ncbi:HNH endonuclease [Rhodococcus erythropolis]|uniref:HNH endonuclease n=1 Tax=Rhodococcus erythropolis TaxID=1833 RepID=UPI0037A1E808
MESLSTLCGVPQGLEIVRESSSSATSNTLLSELVEDRRARLNREYWARNPHRRWRHRYLQRCKKYALVPTLVPFTKEDLVDAWGDRCFDCGDPDWDQLDHRTPVAAGGSHDLENCRPVCASCNRRKYRESDRLMIAAFRKEGGS